MKTNFSLTIPADTVIGYPRREVHRFKRERRLTTVGGSLWLVRGANGAGKSTLLKTLAGGLPTVRGGVIFSPAAPDKFFLPDTLILPDDARPLTLIKTGANRGAALTLVEKLSIPDRPFGELSWGNRRKAALGLAYSRLAPVIASGQVVIWDEPFTGLDDAGVEVVVSALAALEHSNRLIILAAHGFRSLEQLAAGVLLFPDL
ncbi:MAG: ATP-binding cassette domain-containing protein [Verrucomicrobiales bacterium]|jgi:ABC-type multidrug transport system ATPase subunit|nr:ATP-binding cassette domain-containing protein [Verrucomicrobiales bacterium]